MSTKNDTAKQNSLELPGTSHGVKQESDNIVSSTDATFSTDATLKNVMVNRRPSSSVVATSNDSTAETKVHAPASVKAIRKKRWRKSVFLNMQDDKKADVEITFPITKKYNICCGAFVRLCCHSLVDTDDLILRQEREQLLLHMHEDEEVQSSCDQRVEYAVNCSMGICLKKPNSCCSYCESCWKHPVMVWGFRFWQVAIFLLFVMALIVPRAGSLMCNKSSFFGVDNNVSNFRCGAVQELLRNSNYTKDSNGYAGMINTMKALSVPVCETIYENITRPISESDCIAINGTYHLSLPYSSDPGTNGFNNEASFLQWHAETRSFIPAFLRMCSYLCIFILFPVSVILVFGMQFQKDDPTEIMFPPFLEENDMVQDESAKEVELDIETGNKKLYSQKFHFIRPKKLLLRASLFWILFWACVYELWLHIDKFQPTTKYWGVGTILGMINGPLVSTMLCGLGVQIHNATTL